LVNHVQHVHLDLDFDLRSIKCGSLAMCPSHASLVYHMCLICNVWLILYTSSRPGLCNWLELI